MLTTGEAELKHIRTFDIIFGTSRRLHLFQNKKNIFKWRGKSLMKNKRRQSLKLSGGYRGACFMILSTLFCMIEN